jgi:hypothetical protein
MSEFWSRAFGPPAQASPPPQGQGRAWWQEPDPYQSVQQPQRQAYQAEPQQKSLTPAEIRQLRKGVGHQNLTLDQAEAIAEYDLATKDKYSHACPECGSGNFILAGTRMPTGLMTTDKCFDCGHSARGPAPAIGGAGGGGAATRQIDTGGAGGQSMFRRFTGMPASYMPRS